MSLWETRPPDAQVDYSRMVSNPCPGMLQDAAKLRRSLKMLLVVPEEYRIDAEIEEAIEILDRMFPPASPDNSEMIP